MPPTDEEAQKAQTQHHGEAASQHLLENAQQASAHETTEAQPQGDAPNKLSELFTGALNFADTVGFTFREPGGQTAKCVAKIARDAQGRINGIDFEVTQPPG